MIPGRLRLFLGAFGDPGHAFPMLALGERLVARGHAVTVETWQRWAEPARAAGMEFVAAPEYPVFPTRQRPLSPYEAVRLATPVTRRAIAACHPDVVVHDVLTLAPALAAELEQVPAATLVPHVYPVGAPSLPPYGLGAGMPRTGPGRRLWSSLDPLTQAGLRRGRRELNDTRSRLGLPELESMYGGISEHLCIVATFPQLEYPRAWPDHVHVVGPVLWELQGSEPAMPPGTAPLVLVAPSTAQDPSHRLLRAALAGLAGLPVRVVAVAGRRPLPRPARCGRSASVVNWLTYSRAMPQASLVITHAGHGTLARALCCGTPVLAVPHSGDMGENAARVEWAGAGVRLPWRLLSPLTLRLAVKRALSDAGYAAHAAQIAAWGASNDGVGRAVELVEELARRS